MYKIYINDKPIIFSNNIDVQDIIVDENTTCYESDDLKFSEEFLNRHLSSNSTIITCQNPEKSFGNFTKNLILIEAAGGIVYHQNSNDILFIFRRNKWDLPKGKIDDGESIEQAALREVEEECGIHSHKIIRKFKDTYHIYFFKNEWVLKKTYWFIMQCENPETLVPQAEEDITEIKWVDKNSLNEIFQNTYVMVAEMLLEL